MTQEVQGRERGPSPRGRGNLCPDNISVRLWRSIPAWAGKPIHRAPGGDGTGVHPRVGGETLRLGAHVAEPLGPSPRGRGNPGAIGSEILTSGSIPAWAGKPIFSQPLGHRKRVHPRVGGETLISRNVPSISRGPSPRGRGNQPHVHADHLASGSIPAWAGKPLGGGRHDGVAEVHPRVGGETCPPSAHAQCLEGPSPRGRGNPRRLAGAPAKHRSIPAWAGKPGGPSDGRCRLEVHPRVGGETASAVAASSALRGPSPRGRGNRKLEGFLVGRPRSIPAWAGKPVTRRSRHHVGGVHPRVGGETNGPANAIPPGEGPSPRGRGNPGPTAGRFT